VTDERTFYCGVLYALREHTKRFETLQRFHSAFGVALEEVTEGPYLKEARNMKMSFDPIFGTYRAAEDMLLEGLHSLLVCFESPSYNYSLLQLSEKCSREELEKHVHDYEVCVKFAKTMYEAMHESST
jgi:hypothetical protein